MQQLIIDHRAADVEKPTRPKKRRRRVTGPPVLSPAHMSRVETGLRQYTQEILEAYAEILGCTPADLISRPPRDPARAYRELIAELPGLERELTPDAVERVTRAVIPRRSGPHKKKTRGTRDKKTD